MGDRFERLTNLVAVLLDTRRPIPLDELIDRVPGYPSDHESARRQFERDKDALRGLGVPVEVVEDAFGDMIGYRVDPKEYELPDLDLTGEERAALHAAVSAMKLEGGEGREALWKLGGLAGEEAPALGALPTVPTLPALTEASRRRSEATFRHRGQVRRLQPFAIIFRRGNWYVVGHDLDRNDRRSFRADRIEGEVAVGPPGAFDRPSDFAADALMRDEPWLYGEEPAVEATVHVDAVVAAWVIQRLGESAVVEGGAEAGDGAVVRMTVTNREAFRSFVLGLLDHAVVLGPPELRDDVVGWLRTIAGVAR
ncbi:MAG: WYL domain-containing protein [Actinobacteria bacterium]|nr:WYL domain-containing protein [Actinomycetota bacterium]